MSVAAIAVVVLPVAVVLGVWRPVISRRPDVACHDMVGHETMRLDMVGGRMMASFAVTSIAAMSSRAVVLMIMVTAMQVMRTVSLSGPMSIIFMLLEPVFPLLLPLNPFATVIVRKMVILIREYATNERHVIALTGILGDVFDAL
jgi:hypothetical protein